MKKTTCNRCGKEFDRKDNAVHFDATWTHDTQTNEAHKVDLCCDCLKLFAKRFKDEAHSARECVFCGDSITDDHSYQWRWDGSVPAAEHNLSMCKACFEQMTERLTKECAIEPEAVLWIDYEALRWGKTLAEAVSRNDG